MKHTIKWIVILFLTTSARDTVTVATDTWPPFRIGSMPSMTGIDLDILKELEKKLDVTFAIQQAPWVRCLYMMEQGQVDIMVGLAWTKERANYIEYTRMPYYSSSPAFYYKKGNKVSVKKYQDLKNYTIGYSRGSAYFEPFNSDNTLKKIDLTDEESMLKMVYHNRVQLIIGTDCQVDYELAQRGWKHAIVETEYAPVARTDLFIGISKKSPFVKRIDELNSAIELLIAQKKITAIAAQYFKKN